MHQRRIQVDQGCCVGGGVNRVVVAGDQSKRGHVRRCAHHGAVHERTQGRLNLLACCATTIGRCRDWCCSTGGATTDGKALHLGCHNLVAGAQLQLDGDNTARGGLSDRGALGGHVDAPAICKLGKRDAQVDDVIQVDGVEQAFDHRRAVSQLAGAQRCVDRRPAGANQHVWRAHHSVVGHSAAGDRGVRCQEGSGQRKRRARHTKRRVLGRCLDLRDLSNRVAGLADRTDTSQARQQLEDAVRQAIAVHNRGGTRACTGRDLDRDVHLTHVERTLVVLQVVPRGISVDSDRPLALTSRVGGCPHVEGVLVQRVCRVGHQVAVPHQGRAGAQIRGLVGGVAASSEAGFSGGAVVDKHLRRGILKTCQQLRNRLVLARNTSNRNRARDNAHLVSGVALILCLPQGVLAKPGLQIRIKCWHPRHRLRVGIVQTDPPRRIARGNHDLARLRVVL